MQQMRVSTYSPHELLAVMELSQPKQLRDSLLHERALSASSELEPSPQALQAPFSVVRDLRAEAQQESPLEPL